MKITKKYFNNMGPCDKPQSNRQESIVYSISRQVARYSAYISSSLKCREFKYSHILARRNKKNQGYTIIETMIAVSIFIIIVTIGIGSLLNASLLHKKSQDISSIIDNLTFIIEDMSKNIRTGYDYHCIDDGITTSTNPHDCANGGGISFKTATGDQWVYAVYPDGTIQKSVNGGALGTFVVLTPSEIKIDSVSSFSVYGALPPPGDTLQPLVTIRLIGTITSKNNVVTPFSLQTTVSERLLDIII